MDFFEVLEKRHSVRKFKQEKISPETVKKLLNAITSAPSAGNLQAYKIVTIKEAQGKRAIADACKGQGFIASAPLILVFFADTEKSSERYSERGKELYSVQDATIAAAYAQLSAVALGLASCWIGAFDTPALMKACNTPEKMLPVAVIPVGFADETPLGTDRASLESLVHENSFE